MKMTFSVLVLALLFSITVFAGYWLAVRLTLPYNEEGSYFDETAMVVLHKQALYAYWIFFLVCLAALLVWFHRLTKSWRLSSGRSIFILLVAGLVLSVSFVLMQPRCEPCIDYKPCQSCLSSGQYVIMVVVLILLMGVVVKLITGYFSMQTSPHG